MRNLLLLLIGPAAFAATLSFEPAGDQLDRDAILDWSSPPANIRFKIFLNTMDKAAREPFPGALTSLAYAVQWDSRELEFINPVTYDPGGRFGTDERTATFVTAAGKGGFTVSHSDGAVAGRTPKFLLDEIKFKTLTTVNDGEFDFRITAFSANTAAGSVMSQYHMLNANNRLVPQVQEIEVQPTPEPSTVVMLASGILCLLTRRWSRRYIN